VLAVSDDLSLNFLQSEICRSFNLHISKKREYKVGKTPVFVEKKQLQLSELQEI